MNPEPSPADTMRRLFERQRAAHFEGIAGAVVQITLPLREALINEALREQAIAATVAIQPDRRIEVGFRGPWWLPFRAVRVQLEEELGVAPSPVLRLRLLSPSALAGGLLTTAANLLGLMPGALRTSGSQIVIDLGGLLRERGFGDLLPLIAAARVETATGILTLALTMRVPDPLSR